MARSFIADSFSVFTTRVAVMCATLVTGVLLARVLGPEGRGAFSALIVVPGFVVALAELGIRQATVYELGKAEYSANAIVQTLLFLLIVSSTLGVIVVAGFFSLVPQSSFALGSIVLVCLIVPLQLSTKYLAGFLLGSNEIQEFNRVSWVPAIATFTLTVLLVPVLALGVEGAIIAIVLAHGAMAAYAWVLVRRRVRLKVRVDRRLAVRMVKLGSVYAGSLFVIGLNYRIDIVFLERLADLAAVGHYSIAVAIAELIWQIPAATGVIVFARSARTTDRAEFSQKVVALFRFSLLLSAVVGVLGALIAPTAIRLVFGEEFLPSEKALRYLIPGIVIMVSHKVLNMDLAGRGRPHVALLSFIPAVLVNIGLNALWIPTMGIVGAALASSVSYALAAVILIVMYSRISGIPIWGVLLPSRHDLHLLRTAALRLRLSTGVRQKTV